MYDVWKKNRQERVCHCTIFLCFVIIVAAMMYYQTPSLDHTSSSDQTQDQSLSQEQDHISTQDIQKTRREFIVEVTSFSGHRCGISVEDEDGKEFYYMHFESDDTNLTEAKINAGVGDTVTVEVLCAWADHALVKLVKESGLFRHTIAYESDFDRVTFIYTIKEDDM